MKWSDYVDYIVAHYPGVYNIIQIILGGDYQRAINSELIKYDTSSILEIGCGTGHLAQSLNPDRYLGVDVNQKYLIFARNKFKNRKTWRFIYGDICNVVLHGFYASVIAQNVIHHLSDKQVNKMFSHLKDTIRYKRIIIVDAKPRIPIVGKILEYLDGGDHFRSMDRLRLLVPKTHRLKEFRYIHPVLGFYKYAFLVILPK